MLLVMFIGSTAVAVLAATGDIVADVGILTIILMGVIPFLTGALTKARASSGVKAVCTAVLAVAGGVVQALIDQGGSGNLQQLVVNSVLLFIGANVVYSNLLKPTKLAPKFAQLVAPDRGIGTEVEPEPPFDLPAALRDDPYGAWAGANPSATGQNPTVATPPPAEG